MVPASRCEMIPGCSWRRVLDAGSGRHYYWDTETDEVLWDPPGRWASLDGPDTPPASPARLSRSTASRADRSQPPQRQQHPQQQRGQQPELQRRPPPALLQSPSLASTKQPCHDGGSTMSSEC
eukprot:TRINITY_DN6181_c0_g1_i3.p2 TRINITY_DN6181_c0_g1~~TRINITY_DN6181_c0_g1_i3.p2  ORF type:complete len:123 (+),score=31.27 TRINITY_DN6181_c0_g1_i3:574-942(+)